MDTRKFLDSDYVKANVNVKQGDIVKIVGDINVEEKDGKDKIDIPVLILRNGNEIATKKLGLNRTNHKFIAEKFGFESSKWMGKEFQVNVAKVRDPSGKFVDGIALSLPNVDLEGEVINE